MLTDKQRAELEELGPSNVRAHESRFGGGRNTPIPDFKCGEMVRSDILDWLADKERHAERRQARTLFWAIVGGVAGVIGVLVSVVLTSIK